MKEKLTSLVKKVFSVVLGCLMICALFVAVCYIIAFIIGLPFSEQICGFLAAYILPYVYILGIFDCLLGTVYLYLTGKHVFVLDLSVPQTTPADEENP